MLAKLPITLCIFLTILALHGCQTAQMEQLQAYDQAVILPPGGEMRCYAGDSVDQSVFPALVPYAVLTSSVDQGGTYTQRFLARRAQEKLHPDVVFFFRGSPYYAGSVSTASAFPTGSGAMAVGFSTPLYNTPVYAVCYRLSPSRIGVRWDETGMVVWVSEAAKERGLLEGDRIVSINDTPIEFGSKDLKSAYHLRRLGIKPGSEVHLVWIRPGTGRMDGRVVAEVNPPIHLEVPCLDLSPPKRPDGD